MSCIRDVHIKPLRPESLAALHQASRLGGNDASVHRLGRKSRRLVDDTRDTLLHYLGLARREVVFCGSMAEANTLAMLGLAQARRAMHAGDTVVVAAEAAWDALVSVLQRHGFSVVRPNETQHGAPAMFSCSAPVALVCTPWVRAATGAVRDLGLWRALAREFDAWWHVDAALGLTQPCPLDDELRAATSITVGSAPLGGPGGIAALVLMPDASPVPLWGGGGQQRGVRSGTSATPLVAGFGAAIRATQRDKAGAA